VVGTRGRGEVAGKGGKRVNSEYDAYCVQMYVNANIIPVETISGMGEVR
jgi:hypothetical protein